MASWIRINDGLTINVDQVTHVEFCKDDAFIWYGYCLEDEDHELIPYAIVLEGEDAARFQRYLSRRGDDIREEER